MKRRLFFDPYRDLSALIQQRENDLFLEIDNLEKERILRADEDELTEYFKEKYSIGVPKIKENEIHVQEAGDAKISFKDFFGDTVNVMGTSIAITIPFEGESEIFLLRPSTFTYANLQGEVTSTEIRLTYEMREPNVDELKRLYMNDMNTLKQFLGWSIGQCEDFNQKLSDKIKKRIQERKAKLTADQKLVESLGIPIKLKKETMYAVPLQQKKIILSLPKIPDTKPEPFMEKAVYEDILLTISQMSLVIERNPKTLSGLDEEGIRNHILIQLNGAYKGQATGETFNAEGKTDILLRYEGKNIFIAECKFWTGEVDFLEAIDQLLGYTTWRDAKTSLILFNKNRNFSAILGKFREAIKKHTCYKRETSLDVKLPTAESTASYVFCHPSDKAKELTLTVMAFDIPQLG